MASPEEPPGKHLDGSPMLGLHDDLIAVILLRLPTLEDVGRAATACPTFRRVIADRSFRRRLRSVHKARFLGLFHGKFYLAKAPYSSAPCARALKRAADFSFSFVPAGGPWFLRDMRDGRALLESSVAAREFAVADPVSRRYALLPPIPFPQERRLHIEPVLVPAGEEEEETAFKVICVVVGRARLIAFLYSSSQGRWCAFPFQGWSASIAEVSADRLWFRLDRRCCADGCFYWRVTWADKILVLDSRRMEFSFTDITHPVAETARGLNYCPLVAETEDGRAAMFTLLPEDSRCKLKFLYSMRPSEAESGSAWQKMSTCQPIYWFSTFAVTSKSMMCKCSLAASR